jgi:hypothetical protein
MGGTSSLDLVIRPFGSGTLETGAAVGARPLEGHTGKVCHPLLTLPMGAASSLDLMTRPFGSGMPRLELQSANL